MSYSVDLLLKKYHFRFAGGLDGVTQLRYDVSIPIFTPGNKEWIVRLTRYSPTTSRELITDAPLESLNREGMEKLAFMFWDRVSTLDETLFDEESKWFRQVGDLHMYLSDIERN